MRSIAVLASVTLAAVLLAVPANADTDDDFVDLLNQNGISIDKDVAVEMAETACDSPTAGVGLYKAMQAMQQEYPQYSLGTVGLVMSQGVLAFCPERLG